MTLITMNYVEISGHAHFLRRQITNDIPYARTFLRRQITNDIPYARTCTQNSVYRNLSFEKV